MEKTDKEEIARIFHIFKDLGVECEICCIQTYVGQFESHSIEAFIKNEEVLIYAEVGLEQYRKTFNIGSFSEKDAEGVISFILDHLVGKD